MRLSITSIIADNPAQSVNTVFSVAPSVRLIWISEPRLLAAPPRSNRLLQTCFLPLANRRKPLYRQTIGRIALIASLHLPHSRKRHNRVVVQYLYTHRRLCSYQQAQPADILTVGSDTRNNLRTAAAIFALAVRAVVWLSSFVQTPRSAVGILRIRDPSLA